MSLKRLQNVIDDSVSEDSRVEFTARKTHDIIHGDTNGRMFAVTVLRAEGGSALGNIPVGYMIHKTRGQTSGREGHNIEGVSSNIPRGKGEGAEP